MSTKSLLQTLVDRITKIDLHKTDRRAAVADKIEAAMKQNGLNRVRFAELLGKRPSEITKWLSGYHNFTLDTLSEIECRLEVRLIDAEAHYLRSEFDERKFQTLNVESQEAQLSSIAA